MRALIHANIDASPVHLFCTGVCDRERLTAAHLQSRCRSGALGAALHSHEQRQVQGGRWLLRTPQWFVWPPFVSAATQEFTLKSQNLSCRRIGAARHPQRSRVQTCASWQLLITTGLNTRTWRWLYRDLIQYLTTTIFPSASMLNSMDDTTFSVCRGVVVKSVRKGATENQIVRICYFNYYLILNSLS